MSGDRPRHMPTDDESRLLRAACLQGDDALAGWRAWRAAKDVATAPKSVVDLLPAVYRNLGAAIGDDAALLRGIYRKTWVQNQLLLGRTAGVLCDLQARGIDTLVLKGAALTARFYCDAGLRPMLDIDVLVRRERAIEAAALLRSEGWRPETEPAASMGRVLTVVRSLDLVRADGARLDLHWHVLADFGDPGDDDDFWAAAVPIVLNDLPARVLGSADQLLHVIYHGAKWSKSRSVVWLMDAHRILEGDASFDWERFVAQAEKRRVTLPALKCLRYLRDVLDVSVPEDVVTTLAALRPDRLTRLDYRAQDTEDDLRGVFARETMGYINRTRRRSLPDRTTGWLGYLETAWGVPARSLPGEMVRRVRGRLRAARRA